jgi:UDP-N-acetylglucosamine diphosphorylase / glucose-1-phosphate thymidylyltransferase / UDP-N-acetylgalactosamine diphosphorylase / glucosamine-1-phosphate N-acetyltransferase / galactosamine-1-phosphate N-acetyltransferase
MRRIILNEPHFIAPFNEPARDLRVQNKPLWLWQRDLLVPYTNEEREYESWDDAMADNEPVESLVHYDNLFFNKALISEFISRAQAGKRPVQLAFSNSDKAIASHVKPLTHSFLPKDDLLLANMWYLPKGMAQSVEAKPLVIDLESRERGYYHVPPYMATEKGELVYQLPRKAFVLVENWVHLFVADILFGVFANGANVEDRINVDWRYKLKILFSSLLEQRQVLSNSKLVTVGKNASIDPSAVIHGPTTIGDNVTIGAGAVIDNCIIGNNVNISQGCQLMLSVVGDGCFLPFRAALFMTSMMENTMVAQNTCLQLCVIGRHSFVGAGTTFTDFNVISGSHESGGGTLKTLGRNGTLEDTNLLILGGCVGHHCRLSSGLIIYPARTIESDVVLLASNTRQHITKNITYEESDHFPHEARYPYPRYYPRQAELSKDR